MCAFYQFMSIMRPSFSLLLGLFWSVCSAAVTAEKTHISVGLQSALEKAEALQLAQHPGWLALLHYKKETFARRFISQADDASFFLAEQGSHDAAAELEADLQAFFFSAKPDTELAHAQCRFPARWWWLKQQLNLGSEHDVECTELETFMTRVAHEKLFLVFPSMYLNNPGSTFGHTFLRFDNEDGAILLSQTLNYSARADSNDDIVSYVSKGLFGGYSGYFRARPYFETVQEYSNIENRDIWEYQLDFSPQEIEQLVRHVWEVKGINFDYYFFRENCSFRLLALLDVMRPNLNLTREGNFPVYAIPVDTVRILADKDLIEGSVFRASLASQIDAYFSGGESDKNKRVLQLAFDETAGEESDITEILKGIDPDEEKKQLLNIAYTLLQFEGKASSERAQAILAHNRNVSSQQKNSVTSENGLLSSSQRYLENSTPTSNRVSPEKGHKSIRLAAGYGQQNGEAYIDLRFRPAFHDLLDAPQGFVAGAAINAFETRVKGFADNLRLESLSLFNVTSLSPFRQWQKPLSWLFDFRFDRTQLSADDSVSSFISKGGIGVSVERDGLMPFTLLMAEWNLASEYEKGYSLLLGVQAGLRYAIKANQVLLSYQVDEAVSGFELDRKVSMFQWQFNLKTNHAVRAEYRRSQYDFYDDEDWSVNYQYYF